MRHQTLVPLLKKPAAVSSAISSIISSLPATGGGITRKGIHGIKKLSGWTGDCMIVRRVSDNVELSIGWDINGDFDWAAAVTFQGASTLRVKQLYDMSGQGYHAVQNTTTTQPYLWPTKYNRGQRGVTHFGGYFELPDMGTMDRRNCTIIAVIASIASGSSDTVLALATGTSTTGRIALMPGRTVISKVLHSAFAGVTNCPSQAPGFHAGSSSSTATKIYFNNAAVDSQAAGSAGTSNGGWLGTSSDAGYQGYHDYYFSAVYDGILSDGQIATIGAEMISKFNILTTYTKRMLFTGDSITFGQGSTMGVPYSRLVDVSLTAAGLTVEIKNTGVSGSLLSAHYSARVAIVGGTYKSGYSKNVLHIGGGSNDFNFAVTGANLYNNTALPYIQYALGLGYTVIINTIMNRTDFSAGEWTEAQAYNQLLRDNAVSVGFSVNDIAVLTVPKIDGIHPTDAGYAVIEANLTPIAQPLLT